MMPTLMPTLMPLMLLVTAPDPDLSWLVGQWCTAPKNDTRTCESWTAMEKGVMRGKGSTRTAAASRSTRQ